MAIVYENGACGTSGAMRRTCFCRGNDIDSRAIEPYHKDGAMLEKSIREAEIESVLAGGAGGFTSRKFIGAAGTGANYLLTTALWTPRLKYPGTKPI